jgi:adenylate cyclase
MLIIAAVMILFGLIAYRFVLNFMIRNLKKLERWALSVSAGNLDSKIVIKTNDEIGRLSDIFNKMIDEITIKYHLEKFVSSSAKSMIGKKSDTSDELELGGTDRKNMVFLFSDVRGFTSFSEKNQPEVVIEVLNFYLELQASVIMSKKGDIDAYVGDEIMAVFKGTNKIERAVETAIEIVKAIKKANLERLKEGHPIFEVGIGINAGDVVVGNIGSQMRMNYTCIGDTVNLAARLCSNAGPEEILVTKETIEKSKKKFPVLNVDPISVKGKEKKISIVKIKL